MNRIASSIGKDGRFPAEYKHTDHIQRMKEADAKVMLALVTHNGTVANEVWPGAKTLARITGLSIRSISNARKRLCELGVLQQLVQGGGLHSSRYRILRPTLEDESDGDDVAESNERGFIGSDARAFTGSGNEPEFRGERGVSPGGIGDSCPDERGVSPVVNERSPEDSMKTEKKTQAKRVATPPQIERDSGPEAEPGGRTSELESFLTKTVKLTAKQRAKVLKSEDVTLAGIRRKWDELKDREDIKRRPPVLMQAIEAGECGRIDRPGCPEDWYTAIKEGDVTRTGGIEWDADLVAHSSNGLCRKPTPTTPGKNLTPDALVITDRELKECDYE